MSFETGFAVIGLLASVYCLFRLAFSMEFVVKHLQIMNANASRSHPSRQVLDDEIDDCTPVGKVKFPE
jgi:hypothetical protein